MISHVTTEDAALGLVFDEGTDEAWRDRARRLRREIIAAEEATRARDQNVYRYPRFRRATDWIARVVSIAWAAFRHGDCGIAI